MQHSYFGGIRARQVDPGNEGAALGQRPSGARKLRKRVARAGLGTGIIRAFAATGGVVTTAGIVFGITMFALAGSSVLSVAQIGVTIGVGLLLDTLVVRTFVLPSIVALLGRWFLWPTRIPTKVAEPEPIT